MIEDKTRAILEEVLRFPQSAIRQLESNRELLTKTLGLIELLKQPGNPAEVKSMAQDQLRKLRATLTRQAVLPNDLLHQARKKYYSFG